MSASRSIESRLLLGFVAAIAGSGLITCTLTFAWALQDANEVADGALRETTSLLRSGRVALPPTPWVLPGTEHDNDVLVWQLPQPGAAAPDVPVYAAEPGLHTVEWRGQRWRVLATPSNPGGWLMTAQRMEVRDEIARNSAVRSVLPLLVLLPLLALLARAVVKRALAPVRRLARHVDGRPLALAAKLPEVDVPAEVHPFVSSIRRLVHELSQALEQQQRFVANAAHELRTPVAALSLQAVNLGNVLADPAARDRMHELSQGIARLQALLEQLMSMARAQLHRPAAAPQRVPLDELVREMLAECVQPAADRGIDIGVDALASDAVVLADRFDLELLLRNAVSNALKFCPPGSEVTLDLASSDGHAVLTVSDDGPGMDADALPFAFEPFYRAPGVEAPGSGLGLAIVATLAQRLEARVTLRANPAGRGMVFEYRQPLAPT